MGMALACLKTSQDDSVAKAEETRKRNAGDEIKEMWMKEL